MLRYSIHVSIRNTHTHMKARKLSCDFACTRIYIPFWATIFQNVGLNRLTLDVFHDKEQLFPPPHSQAHTYIDTTAIQKDDLEKSTHPFCTPTGGVNQVDTNSLISGCETLTSSRFEAVAGVFRVQVESERSTTHSDRSPLPLSHWACSTHLAYVMHTCTHSHTHAPTHKKR